MSVTQSPVKAKYATVNGVAVTIAKVNDVLYVIYDDDRIARFTPQMALQTVILGSCALADTQNLADRIAGGAARICTSRQMEVA